MLKKFLSCRFDVQSILITTLLSNIGIFMVVPFLAVYLSSVAAISAWDTGLIIGIAFWCQRAGSLLGGLLSDYCDIKKTMFIGLAIRIPGYIFVGLTTNFYLLAAFCALIGLGSSIYLPAAKAYLVKTAPEAERIAILSLRSVFSNIGVAVGPLIGAAIFKIAPAVLFIAAGLIFCVLLWVNGRLRADVTVAGAAETRPAFADFYRLLTHKAMLAVSFFTFIFTGLYIQLESTMPLFINSLFGELALSCVFIVNALIVIFFQMPVAERICGDRRGRPLIFGFLLLGLSFLLLQNITGHTIPVMESILFLAIIAFSFAEIIIQIRLDYAATLAAPGMIATGFGVMSLAGAFGGLAGSALGAYYYPRSEFGLPLWAMLAAAAVLAALLAALAALWKNEGIAA